MNTSYRSFTSMPAILAGLMLVIGLALLALALEGGGQATAALPLATDTPAPGIWSPTGSLNTARQSHTATLLPNSQVLVAGGYGNGGELASAELYDPATGMWSTTGSLNTRRTYHTATLLSNGQVLAAGGSSGSSYLSAAELYDPATGVWTPTGSLNTARGGYTATLLPNGKVLIAGGSDGINYLASAELYDPATGTWSPTGSMGIARDYHTATLLPNGQVLVAGGFGDNSHPRYLASAELYDPATGLWSPTDSLNTARERHTATLLLNGQVLVASGFGDDSYPHYLTSAELYDPATGLWISTGSLGDGREFHTATLLPDGQVLAAGGWDGSAVLSSAELYNPSPPPTPTPTETPTATNTPTDTPTPTATHTPISYWVYLPVVLKNP